MKGKELLARILQECENKRVGNIGEVRAERDALCKFTGHGSTEGMILKVKYIEWGKAAANGENFRLNGVKEKAGRVGPSRLFPPITSRAAPRRASFITIRAAATATYSTTAENAFTSPAIRKACRKCGL